MTLLPNILRGFRRRTDGSTTIEFGLVVVPFLALLFGALQLFLLSFAQQILETAAEASGRLILTGNAQKQSLTAAQFQQTLCKSMPAILSCNNAMVDVQVATSFSSANTSLPTLTYDQNGNVTNQWQYQPGISGNIVVVRIMYVWPITNLLTLQLSNLGGGSRLLIATAVFRNE